MTTGATTNGNGQLARPMRTCDGCGRSLPIRVSLELASRVRRQLKLDPYEIVLSYRCTRCQRVTELAAQDLYLGMV